MLGYTDKHIQTQLIETGFKPLLSPDRIHANFTTTAVDGQPVPEPLTPGSPINLTLGDTSRPPPATAIGNWSDLVRRQVNLGDTTSTSSFRFRSNLRFPSPELGNWNDLVLNQVDLGGYTSTSTPLPSPSPLFAQQKEKDQTMNVREKRVLGVAEYQSNLTWDELVQQGAMLGDDGTDTLVMKKKAPLFE